MCLWYASGGRELFLTEKFKNIEGFPSGMEIYNIPQSQRVRCIHTLWERWVITKYTSEIQIKRKCQALITLPLRYPLLLKVGCRSLEIYRLIWCVIKSKGSVCLWDLLQSRVRNYKITCYTLHPLVFCKNLIQVNTGCDPFEGNHRQT